MSLAWPSLPWRDQPFDLALDLAGLARLLVVVGLLQRLRRLGLDRRLDGRDERLLVERPGRLGVHRVDLGRLRLPREIVGRRDGGVLGLLRLRRRRRVRPLAAGEALDVAGDLGERRVLLGRTPGGGTGGASSLSGVRGAEQALARRRPAPAARRASGRLAADRLPASRPPWACGCGLAQRVDRRDGLRRRHGLLRRPPLPGRSRSWSPPAPRPAASSPRGRRAFPRPSPALSPFSTASIAGLVAPQLRQGAVDLGRRPVSPGDFEPRGHESADGGVAGASLQRQEGAARPARSRARLGRACGRRRGAASRGRGSVSAVLMRQSSRAVTARALPGGQLLASRRLFDRVARRVGVGRLLRLLFFALAVGASERWTVCRFLLFFLLLRAGRTALDLRLLGSACCQPGPHAAQRAARITPARRWRPPPARSGRRGRSP